ncbi:Inner membrane protein YbaN [bioreactor metagenome]|uniref:Inner membrane protein YbaN n=1 Tax=bioreactor metagenome TaxID=1076179 RepID=A0A645B880_9ZZZZ
MKKILLTSLGIICVALGFIGAFLPVLPTTPFLLVASFCFIRSSPKLHKFLLTNPILGEYLTNYFENKALPLSSKIKSISVLWTGLIATIIFTNISKILIAILIIIGICVTVHLATLGKQKKNKHTN